jgi:hypothetical protein
MNKMTFSEERAPSGISRNFIAVYRGGNIQMVRLDVVLSLSAGNLKEFHRGCMALEFPDGSDFQFERMPSRIL